MRILALCLMAAACATPLRQPAQTAPLQLAAGAPIAAPDGLTEYCARLPGECGGQLRADLRGRIPATGAARYQNANWDGGASERSVFHAMLAARMNSFDAIAAERSSRMPLSTERWRQLREVNREINRAIRPATDRVLYGREEFWQRPLSVDARGARGDCEDYALEKRARLLALGWSPDMLAMAVAVAPRVGLHATLIAQTDRGDFVLDNLSDEPRTLAQLDYVWISRQSGPSLANWSVAQVSGAPASARSFAGGSAEDLFQRMMRERSGQETDAAAQAAEPVSEDVAGAGQAPAPAPAPPQEAPAPVLPPMFAGVADGAQTRPAPPRRYEPIAPPALAGGVYLQRGSFHIDA